MNSSSKCNSCGWHGYTELTIWFIENGEESTDYSSRCPICLSTDVEDTMLNEDDITGRFESILSKLEDINTEDARDLEINVKLLQDKVRDKYFRMDERKRRRALKQARKKGLVVDE